jgi:DNA-binding winged helix-turn-helix (wHTH) protein/predicted ATPase
LSGCALRGGVTRAKQGDRASVRYAFGQFEVDLKLFELRKGGERVRIDPKVFDLLVFLLQHHGRVVTKQELLDAVWADEHVVEAVLPTTIKRLRTALGQGRDEHGPIATERGRGYRFIGELRGLATPREAAPVSPLFPREAGTNLELPALGADEPLIGRDDELASLERTLHAARDQRPRMRLVTGEPGVGRSRLLAEAGELARQLGMPIFSARGRAGAPALWPWSQVARQALASLGDDPQSRLPAGLVDELAPLAPAARSSAAPQATPFALADALRALLHALASSHAPCVVLDDLQYFDAASLEVLSLLADGTEPRRPFVLAAVCEEELPAGHPALAVLAGLDRAERMVRVPLAPFGLDEVRRYLHDARGPDVPETAIARLAEQSAGLPAVLRHIVRSAPADALQRLDPLHDFELPERAREPARRRLRTLGNDCLQLLRAASVVGDQFNLSLISELTEQHAEDVLRQLDRACEAGVVIADAARTYRFANRLLRDALYLELAAHERRRLHRRAADALERRALPTDVETHALAHHFHSALPSAPVDKALHYSLRAAQISEASEAYPKAAEMYARALEALGYSTQRDLTQSGELLLDLARVQLAGGNPEQARGSAQQALAMATRGHDTEELIARAQAMVALAEASEASHTRSA